MVGASGRIEWPFADLRKTERSWLGRNIRSCILNMLNLNCLINIQTEIPNRQLEAQARDLGWR